MGSEGFYRSHIENQNPVECEIEMESKLNLRYRLLWLVLWPIYVFEWAASLGAKEELRDEMWDNRLWYYKIIMWHQFFQEWGDMILPQNGEDE